MRFATFAICADFKTTDLIHLGTIGWGESSEKTDFLQEVQRTLGVEECFFLQSCNRREFYFYAPDLEQDLASFQEKFLAMLAHSLGTTVEASWFNILEGEAAVRHLFRVAASLESMVLGETEIMKQLRDQISSTVKSGVSSKRLRTLVEAALRSARQVRTETKITRNVTSMSSLILRAVRGHLKDRHGHVVFVGAGHFMETILPPFAKLQNCDFTFVNRTLDSAQTLAGQYGGSARSLVEFKANPQNFDVLISATSAPHILFDQEWLNTHQGDQPIFLVDGALPGDIAPCCARRPFTSVMNLAHMEEVLAENRARRLAEVPKAEPIFDAAMTQLQERWDELDLGNIHADMAAFYQDTTRKALDYLFKQHQNMDEQQRQILEQFSSRLAKRLVSVPVLGLKGVARELGEAGVDAYVRGVSNGSPLFTR